MKINMTVTTDKDGNDVFRLLTDTPVDVAVTSNKGTEQLKLMFNELLRLMLTEEVEVGFEATAGYGNKMYEDVCGEYVTVLSQELVTAREKLVSEGLIESKTITAESSQ